MVDLDNERRGNLAILGATVRTAHLLGHCDTRSGAGTVCTQFQTKLQYYFAADKYCSSLVPHLPNLDRQEDKKYWLGLCIYFDLVYGYFTGKNIWFHRKEGTKYCGSSAPEVNGNRRVAVLVFVWFGVFINRRLAAAILFRYCGCRYIDLLCIYIYVIYHSN